MNTLTLARPMGSSNSPKYDLAVFIGRFQPFHEGHASVVRMALENARHVLVLIGSAFAPRSHRNPFTYDERKTMVHGSVPEKNIHCLPIEDAAYNDAQWLLNAQRAVDETLDDIADDENINIRNRKKMTVALIGHNKDQSSFYLDIFGPGYHSMAAPNYMNVSSTPMRNAYFSNICEMWLNDCDGHREGDRQSDHLVTPFVRGKLMEFAKTPDYKSIRDEYEFVLKYIAKRRAAESLWGFPIQSVTVDAMLMQSGRILLIKRGGFPYKGLWALPGGFINPGETIENAMLRELAEETLISKDAEYLRKCIVSHREFDDPNRDPRGRVITTAYRLDLPPKAAPVGKKRVGKSKKLIAENEVVEGADDAAEARWFPLHEINREMMAFDHMDVIRALGAFN